VNPFVNRNGCFLAVTLGKQQRAPLQGPYFDFYDLAGLHKINGSGDACRDSPQRGPVIRGEDHESQLAVTQVLLVVDILVARKQHIEPCLLRSV